jgi:hypothetical protein
MTLNALGKGLIEQNAVGTCFALQPLGAVDHFAKCGVASTHACPQIPDQGFAACNTNPFGKASGGLNC